MNEVCLTPCPFYFNCVVSLNNKHSFWNFIIILLCDTLKVMAARDRAAKSGATTTYCWLRNQALHLVRRDSHRSARNFVSNSVINSGSSAAKLWRLANTVLGRVSSSLPSSLIGPSGTPVTDSKVLANMMNSFFIEKISKLSSCFKPTVQGCHPTESITQMWSQDDQLSLSPPSPSEVMRAIGGLRRTGATGENGMTVSVLQLAAPIIAVPVAHLIALSLAKERFQRLSRQQ